MPPGVGIYTIQNYFNDYLFILEYLLPAGSLFSTFFIQNLLTVYHPPVLISRGSTLRSLSPAPTPLRLTHR